MFKPLEATLEREAERLADALTELMKNKVPTQMKSYDELFIGLAFYCMGFLTTFFAFGNNKLYVPKDKRDGEFLTLIFIG